MVQGIYNYLNDKSYQRPNSGRVYLLLSLPSHALGLIHPDLPDIISHQQRPSEKNIDLSAEADWLVAIRKTLARQSTYNNVISEILKGITRIVGWMLLTLVRK